ncbi:pyridoxal phosphate-dependent aminotransferase [Flintibacter sp. KGMB00164]|uniref:pyridoxal phosphate-dependent aminotransferase n=1 Tax=Flintibacter sp. KGMB00164 TaxID=2610895 RepID=UPI001FA9E07E|nr:pyridoxal phosphate-dependent aminotransferase [Flintibacter sp. KGMB00164]
MATTLAERMSKFSGSPTSALIAKVAELKRQGKDIISLNVGEPDFGTPDYIKVAGMKAIADNFTKYTPGNGILELRQAIVKKLKEDNGLDYTVNEVTTAVGAKQAIASAMMVIAGPGDEILLPIPCWVSYTEMIRLAGATPVFVPVRQDNYELDLDAIRAAITPRTKAIVICTPNNPTGAVYSEESLRELADLAVKHDFFIVADEIYEKMVYDGAKHFSVASISREVWERTITVNGFSKAYAMTGWRIGYAAARADVIKGIMAVQSQTTSATSAISQKAALAALQGSQHDMQVMVEEFKRRKDYVVQRLNAIEGITCPDVKGAFYVYPDVQPYLGKRFGDKVIENAVDLCQYLLDEALISTVPGEAYNVPGKIRISYSNSMENLEKALDRLEHALVQLK